MFSYQAMLLATLEFNQRDLGHGASGTVLHPLVALGMLITMVLMLRGGRKYAVGPLLICTFLVPRGQEVMLGGAHLYVRLILVLVGFTLVIKGKFRIAGGLNSLDKVFIVWACYRVLAISVTNWPDGLGEQGAFLLQALCGYFLLRYLIQDEEDIARAAKALAIAAFILGICMVWERHTLINPFGTYLGGQVTAPEVRDGSARAQATFGHSILAGCFGGTLIPLFVWLWMKKIRVPAVVGLVGATLMVLTANSSTPLLAYVAGILGLLLWPVRRKMKVIRWAIVATLAGLAVVMDAPVWFVIAHINVVGGSGGYDRAILIDTCIRHFKDWWLFGTNQNGNWGYDMWDLSDQFVAEAEMGGLVSVVCFIVIIVKSFSRLGTMRKRVRPKQQWLFWCLGSIMLSNIFAYFGVAYWDQTQIWWFTFLAMIVAATVPATAPALAKTPSPSRATVMLPEAKEPVREPSPAGIFAHAGKRLRPWGGPEL
ncbi:MAG TPA: hypothetical protein VHU89_05405 [Acidobacteriaceae bacterium]|jgi:hypothetical protein|nr:hypothetical protein [Acidobacteriaceae bacterium]